MVPSRDRFKDHDHADSPIIRSSYEEQCSSMIGHNHRQQPVRKWASWSYRWHHGWFLLMSVILSGCTRYTPSPAAVQTTFPDCPYARVAAPPLPADIAWFPLPSDTYLFYAESTLNGRASLAGMAPITQAQGIQFFQEHLADAGFHQQGEPTADVRGLRIDFTNSSRHIALSVATSLARQYCTTGAFFTITIND